MASYSINVTDDGSGNFTVAAFRAPSTPASGGTSLTIPWVENTNAGANTVTKLLGVAVQAAFRACADDRSVNG